MNEKMENKQIEIEKNFLQDLKQLQKDLYKIAKVRFMQDEDIFDAIQETIIIAYQYIKKGKKIDNFKSWIISVLINECNYLYKKQKKQNMIFEKEKNYMIELSNLTDNVDSKISFEKNLASLKYRDRLIISLYYGSQFTTKEISKILHMNENTVKTKISRSKQKIKKQIEGGNI